jgi:hypothetical protein
MGILLRKMPIHDILEKYGKERNDIMGRARVARAHLSDNTD